MCFLPEATIMRRGIDFLWNVERNFGNVRMKKFPKLNAVGSTNSLDGIDSEKLSASCL
jgi:hypothetical protein